METITKFKAYNGTEFTDPKECETYEAKCMAADTVISRLPPKPASDGCSFENGHGFIQHDKETFLGVRRDLLNLALEEWDHKWFHQSIADESIDPSWAGRLIGEGNNKNLNNAWHRISCTDKEFREWGQPYYALHPNEGEQIRLNA